MIEKLGIEVDTSDLAKAAAALNALAEATDRAREALAALGMALVVGQQEPAPANLVSADDVDGVRRTLHRVAQHRRENA